MLYIEIGDERLSEGHPARLPTVLTRRSEVEAEALGIT